jgi:hypothetical protein
MKRKEGAADTANIASTCYISRELHERARTLQLCTSDSDLLTVEKLNRALQEDFIMKRIHHVTWTNFKEKYSGKDMPREEMRAVILKVLEETGGKQLLLNAVQAVYRTASKETATDTFSSRARTARRTIDEPVVPIRDARYQWENGIYDEVLTMTLEGKRPFVVRMPVEWTNLLIEKIFTFEYRDSIRFLFDSDDLLETAVGIMSNNSSPADDLICPSLGLLNIALSTPTCATMMEKFRELSCECAHIGIDESYCLHGNRYLQLRQEEAEAILKMGSFHDAREYLRRGSPPALRGRLWRLALGLSPDESADEGPIFRTLLDDVHSSDYITDELFVMDVLNVVDDPNYFIFDETLREVVLAFSRDRYVREHSEYELYRVISEELTMPSAVQPFLGLACYFAPLGYVCRRGPGFYSLAREIYCQVWCRMVVLSGDAGTLLHVCKTFENLILEAHPRLFLHLVNIGIQPLQIAFQWIQLGFVGFLEVDQLLLLWDRILGYNDTSLLAVLAASIFLFRAESLLSCTSALFAEKLMSEFSRVKILPLLQLFFMGRHAPSLFEKEAKETLSAELREHQRV